MSCLLLQQLPGPGNWVYPDYTPSSVPKGWTLSTTGVPQPGLHVWSREAASQRNWGSPSWKSRLGTKMPLPLPVVYPYPSLIISMSCCTVLDNELLQLFLGLWGYPPACWALVCDMSLLGHRFRYLWNFLSLVNDDENMDRESPDSTDPRGLGCLPACYFGDRQLGKRHLQAAQLF